MINTNTLKKYLSASKKKLLKGKKYRFIDHGADILVVCHCDTVIGPPKRKDIVVQNGVLYSPCLDDRLGVYLALCVLPHLGIKADILLTDDEEIGASTAQFFKPKKEYNWVVELDRAGTDVVTYEMDSVKWIEALENVDLHVGWGSFSDICFLDSEACMMNLGLGHYKSHQKDSYVILKETEQQMKRLVRFYNQHHKTKFVQDPATRRASYWGHDLWNPKKRNYEYGYDEVILNGKEWESVDLEYDDDEPYTTRIEDMDYDEWYGASDEEYPLMFFCEYCYQTSEPEVRENPQTLDYYIVCPFCGRKTKSYWTKNDALLHETCVAWD